MDKDMELGCYFGRLADAKITKTESTEN